jgi:rRNA maturation RNase YbeY
MKNSSIHFFKESVSFRLTKQNQLQKWIKTAAKKEKFTVDNLNYIFCSDKYLKKINKDYLNHNYFTDIITFDISTQKGKIEGDIFISVDRVQANAKQYKVSPVDELRRVMIHGLLHLTGYKDKTPKDQAEMRKMEDYWLAQFEKLKA